MDSILQPVSYTHLDVYKRQLWNSAEQIEKARDSQLAREIEAALPRELSREQQLALVRAYVCLLYISRCV